MTKDELSSRITEANIVSKANLTEWIRLSKIRADLPAALPIALKLNRGHWNPERLTDMYMDRLAIEELVQKRDILYLPAPGTDDARLILPLERHPDIPEEFQRQIAAVSATHLIILDFDPWTALSVSNEDCENFWREQASARALLPAKTATIRALTSLGEAVHAQWRKQWQKGYISNQNKELLEAHGFTPYLETACHVFAWNESGKDADAVKNDIDYLEQLIFKKIRLAPKLYPNLGDDKRTGTLQHGPQETNDEKELRDLWKGTVRRFIEERHSDISVTPNKMDGLVVASRKAGASKPRLVVPPSLRDSLYRLAMSGTGINVLENAHTPKDARGTFKDPSLGRDVDFRYGILPGPPPLYRPKITLRILDPLSVRVNLDRLATHFPEDNKLWAKILGMNTGLGILCGPTGSGKSTTLYALLNSLHQQDPGLIIHTVEDPIEFMLGDWLHQSTIKEDVGVTWSKVLRMQLRSDLDYLMVGEMRDKDSANATNEIAASGHGVFSTLHCDSSRDIPTRLDEMGVNMANAAYTLNFGVAQRLVPLSCPRCQRALTADEKERARDCGCPSNILPELVENTGCPACDGDGVIGRTAIQEFTFFDKETKPYVLKPDSGALHEIMAKRGLPTLRAKAWELGRRKLVPLSSILDV